MKRALLIVLALASCAPQVAKPVMPVEELAPSTPQPSIAVKQTIVAAKRLLRDSAATRKRASCYVTLPSTSAQAIDNTIPLVIAAKRAAERLEARHRGRVGYDPNDIKQARDAADVLSKHLPEPCPPLTQSNPMR